MQVDLSGEYQTWNFNGTQRKYADVTLSYQNAKELIKSTKYSALSGNGEQRATLEAHVRKLKREILSGNYTPTQMSAGLQKKHRAKLVLDENGKFQLSVDSTDPLSQTDGGHRYSAFHSIESELLTALKKAEEKEKPKLEQKLQELRNLPCGFRIYFDGNPKTDFINLQAGRPVDNSHMFSLKIQQRVVDDPSYKLAFDVAKLLNKDAASPFHDLIRFDSKISDKGTFLKQIPISTLCAKGTSDIGTSLIGLARVGILFGCNQAEVLAQFVTTASSVIAANTSLSEGGKALSLPRNGGSKGSATMLIGVAIALAYQVLSSGHIEATKEDRETLETVLNETLNVEIDGTFSSVFKRRLLGGFVRAFLTEGEMHDGIPVRLLETLSASTYDAESLPRKRREQGSVQANETVPPEIPGDSEIEVPAMTEPSTAVSANTFTLEDTQQPKAEAESIAPWEEVQA